MFLTLLNQNQGAPTGVTGTLDKILEAATLSASGQLLDVISGRAGRWILAHGPKRVVNKQGEFGALLIEPGRTFYVPAFPLEEVFDPTGAGDAFAGGFMGYLARAGAADSDHLRRAMVYGAAMGSFAVSQFGIRGFDEVTTVDVEKPVRAFYDLTHVAEAERVP